MVRSSALNGKYEKYECQVPCVVTVMKGNFISIASDLYPKPDITDIIKCRGVYVFVRISVSQLVTRYPGFRFGLCFDGTASVV
jgi:hypothetical protein